MTMDIKEIYFAGDNAISGTKASAYQKVYEKIRLYLEEETDPIARMAETVAIIHEEMHFFWTGFYRVMPKPGTASGAGASSDALDAAPETASWYSARSRGRPHACA